jgi:hypothetical protein
LEDHLNYIANATAVAADTQEADNADSKAGAQDPTEEAAAEAEIEDLDSSLLDLVARDLPVLEARKGKQNETTTAEADAVSPNSIFSG